MTVKELIKELSLFPDNMEIFIANTQSEFQFGLLNSVYSEEIRFSEDSADSKELAREIIIILEE